MNVIIPPQPTPPHPVNPMNDIKRCKTLVRFSIRRLKLPEGKTEIYQKLENGKIGSLSNFQIFPGLSQLDYNYPNESIGKSIGLSQLHRCPEKQLCHRDNRPPVLRTDWLCPMRNVWDSARLQGTKVQLSELSNIQWLCISY